MSPVPVSAAGLTATIKANPGATIVLPPGPFPMETLVNLSPAKPVVITSQDPKNRAVITAFRMANCNNITFRGVDVTFTPLSDGPNGYYAWRMSGCTKIVFDDTEWYGDPTVRPGQQLMGLYMNTSRYVTFKNSWFHDMNAAIIANTNKNVTVDNCLFTRLNKSGIGVGGCSYFRLQNSIFRDFIVEGATHPDALQGFQSGTQFPASDNWTVTNNLISRGVGDPIQGIFIQDETGKLPYKNVTVSRNVILGGFWDSLWLNGIEGNLIVTDNLMCSGPGKDYDKTTDFSANLVIQNAAKAKLQITGNSAQAFILPGLFASGEVPPGNAKVDF